MVKESKGFRCEICGKLRMQEGAAPKPYDQHLRLVLTSYVLASEPLFFVGRRGSRYGGGFSVWGFSRVGFAGREMNYQIKLHMGGFG